MYVCIDVHQDYKHAGAFVYVYPCIVSSSCSLCMYVCMYVCIDVYHDVEIHAHASIHVRLHADIDADDVCRCRSCLYYI